MNLTDHEFLKLHVDETGCVWFADGPCQPIRTHYGVADFVAAIVPRKPLRIRVLGIAENASLITSLYGIISDADRLEVAAPAICENLVEGRRHCKTLPLAGWYLNAMRHDQVRAACGGWHSVTHLDYATYRIAAALHQCSTNSLLPDDIRELVRQHAVFRYWQFVAGFDEQAAGWLMYFILDPRWYTDRRRPDRSGRLRTHMGVQPGTYRRYIAGKTDLRTQRLAAVVRAWSNNGDGSHDLQSPGMFLQRAAKACKKPDTASIRVSGRLLTYVRHTWLHAIYATTRYCDKHGLFMPSLFFKTSDEIAAFNRCIHE